MRRIFLLYEWLLFSQGGLCRVDLVKKEMCVKREGPSRKDCSISRLGKGKKGDNDSEVIYSSTERSVSWKANITLSLSTNSQLSLNLKVHRREIWGCYDDALKGVCLLGCCTMQPGRYCSTFQRNVVPRRQTAACITVFTKVHTTTYYFPYIHFNIILHLCLILLTGRFPSRFLVKVL
jgi:hypothetical protein